MTKIFANASDSTILAAATILGRVVITRDSKTFPALAGHWTETGRSHAGVIVISPRISNRDVGRELQSILAAIDEVDEDLWSDRVAYTRR